MKKLAGQINVDPPWQPAPVEPPDIQAIQALTRGAATAEQQVRIVKWLERASAVGEMSYRESERDSAFAEGKRFVGLQFFTLAKAFLPDKKQG